MKKSLNYFSYLLRLWREDDATPWRASLEDPHTGQRRNFARLQDLFGAIEEETSKQVDQETSKQVDKEQAALHEDHEGH